MNMPEEIVTTPRIFISYSWTTEEYLEWVRQLATDLAENNIDVELDQWSLREGDNKFVYMEKMVTDKTIQKVIILCDKMYQEKADGKDGGVGTEATIMTPRVYESVKEDSGSQKFIPVVTERHPETKKEFMPAFLDGKKYIDFTKKEEYTEKLEQLVRAIHNKPLLMKPQPGKMPAYLLEDDRITLSTSTQFRRALDLVKNDKPQAFNAVRDYFSIVSENLGEYDFKANELHYDLIIERIKEMLPVRDEIVDLISSVIRYSTEPRMYEAIHSFFESLIPYFELRIYNQASNRWSADHYKFFVHELFLYTVAILLKNRRFEELNELIGQGYYQPESKFSGGSSRLTNFCVFDTYSEALNYYNKNLDRSYYSIYGKFLSDRATRSDINFDNLAQADFFLYLRYQIDASVSNNFRHCQDPKH